MKSISYIALCVCCAHEQANMALEMEILVVEDRNIN